jgi:2-keto-4-pentenoate hydratase/2-oxohepta-3-ene-1,7-dioic acid hydratase in catechol pathway
MLLVTFSVADATPRLGVLADGSVRPVEGPTDMLSFIQAGPDIASPSLRVGRHDAASGLRYGEALPLDSVRLHAPFRPGKIIGVGLNYVEHVEESHRSLDTAKDLPDRPVLFSKPATAVVGPGEPILHDGDLTQQLDWECELAVVIGRTARRVRREDALAYVFGYSIMNDISARDQRRGGQWFFSKGQDSYAPFGPAVRTADEVPDPQALGIRCAVNGQTVQDSSTGQMVFGVAELVSTISRTMTLEPGDCIATGTPPGVGMAMTPPRYLTSGDVVTVEIDGLGTLTTTMA